MMARFLGISAELVRINTFVKGDCGVEHSTHAGDSASEDVVERSGNANDDASNGSIVERVVFDIDHRENRIKLN